MKPKPSAARMGRPRSFDPDKALDRALQVFWQKGYEGASLSDLTRAMGINRPSLYAAFGDKEALFRRALDRYAQGPAAFVHEALQEPTARRVAERLLRTSADLLSGGNHPSGCLLVQGALACGEASKAVQQELAAQRRNGEAAIRRRLQRAKAEGDLPAGSDPTDLARFLSTVMQGMSVQAAGGAGRAELQRVADTAIRAWPK